MIIRIIILLIGAGLSACSFYSYKSYNADRISINSSIEKNAEVDSMIAPYRRELSAEMDRVLGTAAQDMVVERPNSLLGQWVADVALRYGKDSILKGQQQYPVVALLNTGGLRAPLSKGPLTVGAVFQVMPFDNVLVALRLPAARLPAIEAQLKLTGGEPISGFKIVQGKIVPETPIVDYFWVITSDFLANGGDKMTFLQSPEEKILTSTLLRDLLMREVERTQTLQLLLEERITF
jgi:2',3'-cyclic-nucleotide 2'-phosphodiesterase (5'-nucleotidase family)